MRFTTLDFSVSILVAGLFLAAFPPWISGQQTGAPPTNQGVNPYKNEAGATFPGTAAMTTQRSGPLPTPAGEEDFSGTVQAVDTMNRTMTIRTSDARIVSRLTPGHQITLWAVMKQTPPVSGLRDPNNRQPKSDPEAEQFTGSFVSSNQAVMTIRVDSSRALTNVPAGKEVSLMVAGLAPQITIAPPAGQIPPTASATSGSAGEGVVSRESQATVQATGAQRISGTIAAIDSAANAIVLHTGGGQQIRVPVDYNTRFTLSSAGGSLGDLKLGQAITVTISDHRTTAVELSPAPTGATTAPPASPGPPPENPGPGYGVR